MDVDLVTLSDRGALVALRVLVGLQHALGNVHGFAAFDEANEPLLDVEVAKDLTQLRAGTQIHEAESHPGRQRVNFSFH